MNLVLITLASILGGLAAYFLSKQLFRIVELSRYRQFVSCGLVKQNSLKQKRSWKVQFFDFANRESARLANSSQKRFAVGFLSWCATFDRGKILAGLSDGISREGFCEARLKLAIFASLVSGISGFVVSLELAMLFVLLGAVYGLSIPGRWIVQLSKQRSISLEHHLPEMLDVIAICMQSGLSFDRSLEIYSKSFDSQLSRELSLAQRMWSSGLKDRDEALRDISKTYDSVIFARTIETVIRSLRLGSSMVESLNAASKEARVVYRAKREEEVAKAPVKMMIPTGTLILPAMLLLVMGPVLLELAGGGV